MEKRFKLSSDQIKPLFLGRGSCLATDLITVEGSLVGYMYREKPDNDIDSGWRFLAGGEDDRYLSDPANMGVYDVNTIANYDPLIIGYLDAPAGSAWRREGDRFVPDALGAPTEPAVH